MKTISIEQFENRGCNGCSKCCEGYLTADIYSFDMSLQGGSCRFLLKNQCGIYPVRPELCKRFLCGWRENTSIPDYMQPSLSQVILLGRYIENYFYYRLVKCSLEVKEYVFIWADQESRNGKNIVGYNNNGKFCVFSENDHFKKLILEKENI